MSLIAIQSLFGGAGATTVCANLAAALLRNEQHVMCVDACIWNDLRLWFGMARNQHNGWMTHSEQAAESIHASVARSEFGAKYVPLGEGDFSQDAVLAALSNATVFDQLPADDDTLILVNLPSARPEVLARWLPNLDLALSVWSPDPRVAQRLQHFGRNVTTADGGIHDNLFLLENSYAPQLELNRDISSIIRFQIAEETQVPLALPKDQHIPEALAPQQSGFEYSIGAASNHVYQELAEWVCQHVASKVGN
ncbi:MAG: hypothetical protein CMF19_07585 [Idiomarinaceae bacterium]|nr:hypothetical protein [Idiomarinaceae bacterium]